MVPGTEELRDGTEHLRSPSLTLLAKVLNDSHHLLSTAVAINHLAAHVHRDLFVGLDAQEPLDQEMSHEKADKNATIATVLLLGSVLEVDKLERTAQDVAELVGGLAGDPRVRGAERIIVKGSAVGKRHDQQGPMATALCDTDIACVVDGQENVRNAIKLGQGAEDLCRVGLLHEEEGHAGTQENDSGAGVTGEGLALQVFLPKGDVVVGQPVVLESLHVFNGEANIVVAEVRLFRGERVAEMAGHALSKRHLVSRLWRAFRVYAIVFVAVLGANGQGRGRRFGFTRAGAVESRASSSMNKW
jgi:hypothetical protein